MGDLHRNYQPSPHQVPSSSTRNQPKQSIPPPQTAQGAYSNQTSQHERAQQPLASGRTNTHSSSAPSRTASIPTTGQHGQIGQYPFGYSASAGSSGSHHAHAAGRSVPIGTALNMLPGVQHPVGGHPAAHPQPQDWNTTGHGGEEHRSSFQPKGRPNDPSATHVPVVPECRFPSCRRRPFFDRRVNEFREWCSDDHLRAAIQNGFENPCKTCKTWPRREGYKYCSGKVCKYPGQ